jgi:hypothetical protein
VTTNLDQWAWQWGVPQGALDDLKQRMGLHLQILHNKTYSEHSEAWVQSITRTTYARAGIPLWRNNVGAMQDPETGRVVRFGLANESKKMNEHVKSHDLIGINPVLITQNHVGQTIGQFVSIETKAPNWAYKGSPREQAQLRWGELIMSKGGIAKFTNGVDEYVINGG